MKTITMKTWLLAMLCVVGAGAYAQVPGTPKKFGKPGVPYMKCASTEYEGMLQEKNSKRMSTDEFEAWLAPKTAAIKNARLQKNGQGTNEVVVLPVVVHIIHNGDAEGENENISEGQVQSQITVLNQDFRKMFGTNGYNENPVGDDMEIEFCLAQRDPNGLATNGIIRYNIGDDDGWSMDECETILKPETQWDPEQYINIWVVDYVYIDLGGIEFPLGGYAQFPTNSGLDGLDEGSGTAANTDGVVIDHSVFGSDEIYPEGTYNWGGSLGRTTTHELGHFFGLRHIWGDGGCGVDDFCEDTPRAAEANGGCPEGMDSCTDYPGLDMIENYMDYTDDACKNIFTADQKDRMMAVMENSPRRANLITSLGCTPGMTYDNDGSLNILDIEQESCSEDVVATLSLFNAGNNTLTSADITYTVDNGPEQTYNWLGSLEQGEQEEIVLPVLTADLGSHELSVAISAVNGGEDETELNDAKTSDFTIFPFGEFGTEELVLTIQADEYGEEIQWVLRDETGATVENGGEYGFFELVELTIPLDGSGCYTFEITDDFADGICCFSGDGFYTLETAEGTMIVQGGDYGTGESTTFTVTPPAGTAAFTFGKVALYPNPASSILNLELPNAQNIPESYELYNSLGQQVGTGKITGTAQTIDINKLSQGVYFIKLAKGSDAQTLKFIKQ